MIRTVWRILPMAAVLAVAAAPVLWLALFANESPNQIVRTIVIFNAIGWAMVLLSLLRSHLTEQRMRKFALRAGIFPKDAKKGDFLSILLRDISRRERALSMPHLEKRIHSREELASALEEVVSTAYELLKAESAELALYDQESGMYHSAFIKGRPFQTSAQAMLSGAVKREDFEQRSDVLIHPITFAGNILGTLRIGLSLGQYPDGSDRKVLTLLAAQAALALTNAQYTEQLLRLKSASEESLRAKTGFLANLSHELRAPLGIILNGVEVVLDGLCGTVSPEQEETLGMIKQNGEHLLDLVNDVLDYAKIESGKLQLKTEEINVQETLKDLQGVVRKQAEEKGHKLTLRGQTDMLAIACDKRHFRQILLNLLTNAIKYTPEEGSIELWCDRAPGGRIAIHVKDNGIGIAHQNHAKVFEAFERVEHSYALSQGGTGLGMPLTKKLVERNGGRIDFTSELDKGSHFWVSFQAISSAGLLHEEVKTPTDLPDGDGARVLLVTADRGDGPVLERYLQSRNFNVATASSDEQILELLGTTKIELLVFESSHLKEWIGELLEKIQGDDIVANKIPVLMLTSRAFSFDVEEFLRLGVDRCLIKPVQLIEVARTAKQLIERKYTGDIIDSEDVTSTKADEDRRLSVGARKLVGVDDLLH
ncbi:MAG: hypothetical protein KDD70_11830 [Bdellovibrionales bacterium]|nr:hypothetical protein [Bdellovibrionales bacterium]